MENVDRCVCCGNIIPEGTMVCAECIEKTNHSCCSVYYEAISKIPRKGLHIDNLSEQKEF